MFCGFAATAAVSTNSVWSVQTWQSEEGLPNNNVAGLAQTPDGYLWMATPSCLARFDGTRFEDFPATFFAPAYENQRIRALLETRRNGLCVGIEPGDIISFRNGAVEIFSNDLPRLTIESLVEDGKGALWITYHGGVVCCIKDGKVIRFGVNEGLPRGTAPCTLVSDCNGQIWFTKGIEAGIFREGRFQTLLTLESPANRLAAARGGGVWICSGFSLYKFVEGAKLDDRGSLGNMHGPVNVVLQDRTGAVWIGTSSGGLFRYDGSHFSDITVSDREILSLTEDREGNIWVGTGGGGLNRLRPRPVTLENAETGMPFESIESLCQETNGTIWATTLNGAVVHCVDDHWNVVSNSDFAGTMAGCVAAGSDGGVWIGTSGHRLFQCRDGRVTSLTQDDGLASRLTHALLVSHAGDLWIAGEAPDSVQCLHDGVFQNFTLPTGVRHLRTLAEDSAGNIWAGGDRGVLLQISGNTVTDESAHAGNSQKTVRCLYATEDGSLWVGFSAGGVGRLKNGIFSRMDVAQGLYVGAINQMISDGRSSIWFGSDQGIFRVREKDLNDVADGRAETLRSIHYGRSEELPSAQARHDYWPGALKSGDGRLWIPLRTGLAVIDPANLHEDLQPPPVLVNRVIVDDQTIALYGGGMPVSQFADLERTALPLRLSPKLHRLEFEFTALSFGPPENIHFRYQLEGFDDHWRDAGNLRSAIYSRLTAGDYTFRVTGCNSDGIWNNQGFALAFNVKPFFWQTWWFRCAALAVFTFIVVAIVRYVSFRRLRMKLQILEQQAALDKERARIARDIHDDLGGSLTQVALLSGLLERDLKTPGKAGEHIHQISATTHQVIKSLDEIVWAVNPRNDTLPDLINYLGQFAVEFLRTAGIQCHVNLPDRPPRWAVTAEARHNLYLVVKEALNNITRHAHASEVWFRVSMAEKSVNIVIEDNGQGFHNGAGDAFADGVKNMRQRMEEIGGQFRVESVPGRGAQIGMTFFTAEGKSK